MISRLFHLTPLLALQASILLVLALALSCGGGESATGEATLAPTAQVVTEDAVMTDTPEDAVMTDTPADAVMTDTPEDAVITGTPEDAVTTGTPEDPAPTDAPDSPSITEDPGDSPPAAQLAIDPILATTVLGVGEQRVAFLLTTAEGLVSAPEASVASVFLGDGDAVVEQKQAGFHLWPYGVRGSYSTQLNFDRPGAWRLDISVDGPDGPGATQIMLEVAEETSVPGIGSLPPFSANKTIYTVDELSQLTTDFTPDPDLYQLTIPEAVIEGKPAVIVFATPAFCTSPTCGPQVDTVAELKDLYRDEANFIHVELYDNPEEIQGDLSKAELSSLVHDWGFTSIPHWFNESWTFVLGQDGRIAQRFEAFATLEELEEALLAALEEA